MVKRGRTLRAAFSLKPVSRSSVRKAVREPDGRSTDNPAAAFDSGLQHQPPRAGKVTPRAPNSTQSALLRVFSAYARPGRSLHHHAVREPGAR